MESGEKLQSSANMEIEKGCLEGRVYETLIIGLIATSDYEFSNGYNSEFCDFVIGKEIKIGKDCKFDDVVVRYTDQHNIKNFIFVQAKHKQDKQGQDKLEIDSKILSTEASVAKRGLVRDKDGNMAKDSGNMARDFNLQKYFISFLNIRDELKITQSEELKGGKIKYVIIFTNVGLKIDDLQENGFDLKKAPDDIINLFTLRKNTVNTQESSNFYQLVSISGNLSKIFLKSSYMDMLAKELAPYVVSESYRQKNIMQIDESPMKHYHIALKSEVIQISDQIQIVPSEKLNAENKSYREAKFRDDFLDNDKSGLLDALIKAIGESSESKNSVIDYELSQKRTELKEKLKKVKWKVDPNFGKNKQNITVGLPCKSTVITENDIGDFLNSLVFIVNQPRVENLKGHLNKAAQSTITSDISLTQILNKIENIGPEFRKRLEQIWEIEQKANYKGKWIERGNILNFFEEQKQFIRISFIVTEMTFMYERKIMESYGEFRKLEQTEKCLNSFLKNDAQLLCIHTPATLFSSIKLLQYLKAETDGMKEVNRIFVSPDTLESKSNREIVAEAFKFENNSLLIIECRYVIGETEEEQFYHKLSKIVDFRKKVILIVQKNVRTILYEKFRNDFQNQKEFIQQHDFIDLTNFEPREDPLKKEVITFQEQEEKVSLGEITGLTCWNSYLKYLSQEGISSKSQYQQYVIHIQAISEILLRDEIKVGCNPLRISSLMCAYSRKMQEEFNSKTLIHKLNLKLSDDDLCEIFSLLFNEENSGVLTQNLAENTDCIGNDSQTLLTDDEIFEGNYFDEVFSTCTLFHEGSFDTLEQNLDNAIFIFDGIEGSDMQKRKRQFLAYLGLDNEQIMSENLFGDIDSDSPIQITNDRLKDEEFKEICSNHTNRKVYWIHTKYTENRIVFTLNQLYNPNFYLKRQFKSIIKETTEEQRINADIDTEGSVTNKIDEINLIEQMEDKKVINIADGPSTGKSTTLKRLCDSFVAKYWVIEVNLRIHLQMIRDIELKDDSLDILRVINFLSKTDIKLNNAVSKFLLLIALNSKHSTTTNSSRAKTLLLALDGFDEVLNENDRMKIKSVLNFLNNRTNAKLWLASRSQCLEDELETFAVEFISINDKVKEECIKEYLKDHLYYILSDEKFSEVFPSSGEMQKFIQEYAIKFLNKMESVFKDNLLPTDRPTSRLVGAPLLLYSMLETFISYFKNWIENNEKENRSTDYLVGVMKVCEKLIDMQYRIYFQKMGVNNEQEHNRVLHDKFHRDVAKKLFKKSQPKEKLQFLKDSVLSVGIVTLHGNDFKFTDNCIRDYFAADVFIHWIEKAPDEYSNPLNQKLLLEKVLKEPDYIRIRKFMNLKLQEIFESEMMEEIYKQFGKTIESLFRDNEFSISKRKMYNDETPNRFKKGKTALHVAAEEGNENIVLFLVNCLYGHSDVLRKLLFMRNEDEETALRSAYRRKDDKTVRMLLDAAKYIPEEEWQEYLSCSVDKVDHNTLLFVIEESTNVQTLKKLLNTSNDKINLILNEEKGISSLCRACQYNKKEFVKAILEEVENDADSLQKLLLFEDCSGNVLSYAVKYCTTIAEYLCSKAKSINDNNETLRRMLRTKYEYNSPLEIAIQKGDAQVIEVIINAASDIIGNDLHKETF